MLDKEERGGGTVDNKRRGSLVPSLFKLQILKQEFFSNLLLNFHEPMEI